MELDARPVSFSQTTLTELMIPSYANFGGKIHGGILLSLIDKVAYACASRHAATYCVTVSVDGVDFLKPVEVGDLVSLMASVNYVGRTFSDRNKSHSGKCEKWCSAAYQYFLCYDGC